MSNPFKNSIGMWYLQALFYEMTGSDKSTVLFTLKDTDHEGYPSLSRLYLETGDPTEYQFAVRHLGGWAHWKKLSEAKWFQEYVTAWREELAVKLDSEALARIIAVAEDPKNGNAYHANKYLLERSETARGAKKRGRPSKGSAPVPETHQRTFTAEIDDDLKRIGIN